VHAVELLERGADFLRLRVECGSGTYIRSLVRDLGRLLGSCAHVAELRRLWVEPFRGARMVTLDELAAAREAGEAALMGLLLPIEAGLAGFPRVELATEDAVRLTQGQRLPGRHAPAGTAAAYGPDGLALGLVEVDPEGSVRPQRLFVRRPRSLSEPR
jgi:tRNA pseudouridine55 synthase